MRRIAVRNRHIVEIGIARVIYHYIVNHRLADHHLTATGRGHGFVQGQRRGRRQAGKGLNGRGGGAGVRRRGNAGIICRQHRSDRRIQSAAIRAGLIRGGVEAIRKRTSVRPGFDQRHLDATTRRTRDGGHNRIRHGRTGVCTQILHQETGAAIIQGIPVCRAAIVATGETGGVWRAQIQIGRGEHGRGAVADTFCAFVRGDSK